MSVDLNNYQFTNMNISKELTKLNESNDLNNISNSTVEIIPNEHKTNSNYGCKYSKINNYALYMQN